MGKSLSVILIEDDKFYRDKYRVFWEKLLKDLWPSVSVEVSEDFNLALNPENEVPHIVIADNVRIENDKEEENLGIDLIASLKKDFPDVVFVLFTGATFRIDRLGSSIPNPDVIVTKTSLPNAAYETEIKRAIGTALGRLPLHRLSFTDPHEASKSFPEGDGQLYSVIEQCIFPFQRGDNEAFQNYLDPVESVTLTKLSGGASGALVYRCELFGSLRNRNCAFVLKIDDPAKIRKEESRYDHFVRLQLPHNLRVELVGSGYSRDRAGMLYGFAFGGRQPVATATELLKAGDLQPLRALLSLLKAGQGAGWYQVSRDGASESVDAFFNERREYGPAKDPQRLRDIKENLSRHLPKAVATINEETATLDGATAPFCRRLLANFKGQSIPLSICHGDLNTGNVISFDDGKEVSLIDFEYAGVDSIYKDFVSLEVSFRSVFNLSTELQVEQWLEIEHGLASAKGFANIDAHPAGEPFKEYATEIVAIRQHAMSLLETSGFKFDARQYLLHLGFHLLKVAAFQAWSANQFTRLFASFVATCAALAKPSGKSS